MTLLRLVSLFLGVHLAFLALAVASRPLLSPQLMPVVDFFLYGGLMAAGAFTATWPMLMGYFAMGPFEGLHRKYRGTLSGPRLMNPGPVLAFEHRRVSARLEVGLETTPRRRPAMVLRLTLTPLDRPLNRLLLEVQPRSQPVSSSELAVVLTGDGEMDEALVVAANPPGAVQLLMAQGLRMRLSELFQMSANLDQCRVSFDADRLQVERSVNLRWDSDWVGWIIPLLDRIGWSLLELLTGYVVESSTTSSEEIQLISEPASFDEAPACLVCAESIRAGRQAFCVRCETPHHLDCWLYNQGCALFACGGDRYRERVVAPVMPDSRPEHGPKPPGMPD